MRELFLRNVAAIPLFPDVFAKESGKLVHNSYPDQQATIVLTLRIQTPRTIILIFTVSLSMTLNRDAILFQILQEQRDRALTVSSVRNEILRRDKSIKLDKAILRRWVNSKFVTLARRGTLEKYRDERGKVFFKVARDSDDDLQADLLPRRPHRRLDAMAAPQEDMKPELNEYRLRALTQMSEMEEYKRIGENYPNLRDLAAEKFEAAVDENCRLLGKIRALEQMLGAGDIK